MRGGLIGGFEADVVRGAGDVAGVPRAGTETFEGCLDRSARDRSCKGDPAGTLSFTFEYFGAFDSPDPASLDLGRVRAPDRVGHGRRSQARRA